MFKKIKKHWIFLITICLALPGSMYSCIQIKDHFSTPVSTKSKISKIAQEKIQNTQEVNTKNTADTNINIIKANAFLTCMIKGEYELFINDEQEIDNIFFNLKEINHKTATVNIEMFNSNQVLLLPSVEINKLNEISYRSKIYGEQKLNFKLKEINSDNVKIRVFRD